MSRKVQAAGPHNERMATLGQLMSGKEVFQLFSNKAQDPLKQMVEKYRRRARNHEPYPEGQLAEQIQPLDKLLEYESRLAPILTSLERENNTLRGEISIVSHELSKSLLLCETLIVENKEMKDIVLNKNEDITKIIETIAVNETEMRGELEHKNYLLQQENSILIKHLQQAKVDRNAWNAQARQMEQQMASLTFRLVGSEATLQDSLSREKDLSKKLFIAQQNLSETTDEVSQARRRLEDLTLENNKMKNQLAVVRVEDKTSVKQQFENEISTLIQQYQALKEERVAIVKQTERLRVESQHWHGKANSLGAELEKAISNLELTNSLLLQQKTKNANLTANHSKMDIRITELKSNNENMRFQLERGQNISLEKEKMNQRQLDTLRGQIEDRNQELDKRLKEIRQSSEAQMLRKQREIEDLRKSNQQLKRLLDNR